jgi:serine phosphatase RsbU (regulator of sigma subunit)
MVEFDTKAPSFREAELRSERTRVRVLLGVLAGLLTLVLIRGAVSQAEGYPGEAWPFAVLLALMTAYETAWLRLITQAIRAGEAVSSRMWKAGCIVEALFPTAALLLQVHSSMVGPLRGLTSPVVLAYFIFIILSTLHLDPGFSRLSGGCSAIGYGAVAMYVFFRFPEALGEEKLVAYAMAFSCIGLLLLGGFAAGAVAVQIRLHVVTALREAESRAKIEHDLGTARNIQQGLLPKAPPEIEGFDIAGWNRPADETGGDYFDWQLLPDGLLAITIADVTGHGIGPALCMSACRAYARAGFNEAPNLREFLNSLNELMYKDLPSEKFVTLAAGLLNPEEATLELISAGHGPLLFYLSSQDRFRSYDPQGVPLGIMPDFRYSSPQKVTFAPGDILVLVTDGFIEWANADDEGFGQHRLKAVIRANQRMPAGTIISELYREVLKFAGPMPQQDDLTVVVVKRTEEPAAHQIFPRKVDPGARAKNPRPVAINSKSA